MSCILVGLVLTTSLYLSENTAKTRLAAQYSSQATYSQCGLQQQIEPKLKILEDKFIPKPLQKLGIGGTFIYRVIKDQRVEYTWSF